MYRNLKKSEVIHPNIVIYTLGTHYLCNIIFTSLDYNS